MLLGSEVVNGYKFKTTWCKYKHFHLFRGYEEYVLEPCDNTDFINVHSSNYLKHGTTSL